MTKTDISIVMLLVFFAVILLEFALGMIPGDDDE